MLWWQSWLDVEVDAVQLWFCWGWRMARPVTDQCLAQIGRPLPENRNAAGSGHPSVCFPPVTVAEPRAKGLRPSQALLHLTWKSQPKAQLQTKLQVKAPAGGVYKLRSQDKWLSECKGIPAPLTAIYIYRAVVFTYAHNPVCVRVWVVPCVLQISSDFLKHYYLTSVLMWQNIQSGNRLKNMRCHFERKPCVNVSILCYKAG